MQTQQIVNMEAIVKFCTRLTIEACQMVKDCYKNTEVKTFMKGVNDPVTEADFKIQTMLIRGLIGICPNLRIVGEEQTDYKGQIATDYQKLPHVDFPQSLKFNNQYSVSDLCVWIDPIDNTKGFISGEIEAVTILIGISYKGKAEIGIVGHPFKKHGASAIYQPSVYVGCASEKLAFQLKLQKSEWSPLKKQPTHESPVIAMSPSRKNTIENIIKETVKGQKLLAGGSGYKIVLVAKGEADLLAYCDPFTKKWDSGAGEAIIKAMGGYFLNTKGEEIEYVAGAADYINKQGILCGFDENLKQVSMKICKKQFKPHI